MINIEEEGSAGPFMRRMAIAIILLFLVGQSHALPNGIGDRADDGCLCHGGADEGTSVSLVGLPEVYNSSMQYNITLTIESGVETNEVQGGFRILISEGEIVGDGWQTIDDGYTHSTEINDRREWSAVWIAPEENDSLASFIIHANAVNGDNSPTNDEWNSQSIAVPGPEYVGDRSAPELSNSLSNSELAIGGVAILLLVGLTIMAVRD